jgi:capsular polysaccharide biosynthesis protein
METNHFLGKRLYISRKYAQKRKISNEADLERVLQKFGFTIVYCEEHSFFGQVSIFSKAQFLISIHGAGLTNMLFMPPGSAVLELHKRKTNMQDQHSLVYWRLASALDHAYYHLICEPSDPEADFFAADFIVDVTAVERILEDAVPKTPVS